MNKAFGKVPSKKNNRKKDKVTLDFSENFWNFFRTFILARTNIFSGNF